MSKMPLDTPNGKGHIEKVGGYHVGTCMGHHLQGYRTGGVFLDYYELVK